jgi:hypothetical protein
MIGTSIKNKMTFSTVEKVSYLPISHHTVSVERCQCDRGALVALCLALPAATVRRRRASSKNEHANTPHVTNHSPLAGSAAA